MPYTADEAISSVIDLYTSDYVARKPFPREYTLFSKPHNEYVSYFIAKTITPKELEYILDLYVETCGKNVEFNHESIKIRRWRSSFQGQQNLNLW